MSDLSIKLVIKKSFINRDIPHVKQKTKNDCGIACFKMALKYFDKKTDLENLEALTEKLKIHDQSLWTIDIAHLCALSNLKHKMYTLTWGVTSTYQTEEFYNKDDTFKIEQARINQLFDSHEFQGINVEVKGVNMERILEEIANKTVCIVLVDATKLRGKNMDDKILNYPTELKPTLAESFLSFFTIENKHIANSSYLGHFIVLNGYDNERERIFYRNPAHDMHLSYTAYSSFEEARKSYGTDQDILFIYNR